MRILGVETSADETGICLLDATHTDGNFSYKILGNALLSQVALHAQYGGIFPNLAKREHGRNLTPVLMECLRMAGELHAGKTGDATLAEIAKILVREHELNTYLATFLRDHGKPNIDCIAVTAGPGLEPALWVGINFAKALSLAWDIPIVAVNHMEGHIAVAMLSPESQTFQNGKSDFPALALLVSGGHTELILMPEHMKYTLIGRTRDDAAGEAFDKTARLMGLPYPGGPEISRLADAARAAKLPRGAILPRPMLNDPSYDFSFSGLKTAVRKITDTWQEPTAEKKMDLSREIEDAIVNVLVHKTKRAVEEYGVSTLIVGGGVSANSHLRSECTKAFADTLDLRFPSAQFSTDNGVMIALAGYFHALKKEFANLDTLKANGNAALV